MHPTVENYVGTKRTAVMQAKCYRRQYSLDSISLVLINLYGPGEHFHPDAPMLWRHFYASSGKPSRPTRLMYRCGVPVAQCVNGFMSRTRQKESCVRPKYIAIRTRSTSPLVPASRLPAWRSLSKRSSDLKARSNMIPQNPTALFTRSQTSHECGRC